MTNISNARPPPPPSPPPMPELEQHRDDITFVSNDNSNISQNGGAASVTGSGSISSRRSNRETDRKQMPTNSSISPSNSSTSYQLLPLIQRQFFERLDVYPFVLIYGCLIVCDVYETTRRAGRNALLPTFLTESVLQSTFSYVRVSQLVGFLFFFTLCLQAILFFAGQWFIRMRVFVGYYYYEHNSNSSIKSFEEMPWTHALCLPPANIPSGKPDIESVQWISRRNKERDLTSLKGRVKYQEIVFECLIPVGNAPPKEPLSKVFGSEFAGHFDDAGDEEENRSMIRFRPLQYPTALPLSHYLNDHRGHSNKSVSNLLLHVYYPRNSTDIPTPSILQLLLPQLTQPFFLFQALCTLLWSLDEYWMYALFTFLSLVLFEWTQAYNRRMNVERLRSQSNFALAHEHANSVMVFRQASWGWIHTSDVVPGDIVSLVAGLTPGSAPSTPKIPVPADVIVLRGSVVVDESMLTGESVPQMKEALQDFTSTSGQSVHLDLEDAKFSKSMVFAGTTVVTLHTDTTEVGGGSEKIDENAAHQDPIPLPPDGGIPAYATRTGWATTRGSLLRTMVWGAASNIDEGVNNADTLVFVFGLFAFALVASFHVYIHSKDDSTRNPFKLLLHLIIIVTSVIPPELPMELSLAITSSMGDLMARSRVWCSEGWRIPLAGRVDVCCFDKTGTLTSDAMRVLGLRICEPRVQSGGSAGKDQAAGANLELEGTRRLQAGDGTETGSSADLIHPSRHPSFDAITKVDDNGEQQDSDLSPSPLPRDVVRVLVGCQSLAPLGGGTSWFGATENNENGSSEDGNIVGDPLEKSVLTACRWTLQSNSTVIPLPTISLGGRKSKRGNATSYLSEKSKLLAKAASQAIVIYQRFGFESKLKRMTVLARDLTDDDQKLYALTKGAPETILPLLLPHTVPSNYIAVTRYHMGRGQRVLALAYKTIPIRSSSRTSMSGKRLSESNSNHGRISEMVATVREEGRASMEKDLCFAGLLVLDCPLKSDSARCINELKASSHKCKMITGDATLTAAEVARQVGIVDTEARDTYDLREMKRVNRDEQNASEGGSNGNLDDLAFAFVPIHKQAGEYTPKDCIAWIPSNMQLIRDIVNHKSNQSHISLIVSGDVLTRLAVVTVKKWYSEDRAKRGRAPSPLDGKTVLLHPAAQNMLRAICPMVSVFARCAPRQKEAIITALNASGCFTLMCGDGTNDVGALKQAHVGISIISVPELEAKERKAKESVQAMKSTKKKKALHARTLERSLQDLAAAQEDLNHVALGDASVASPFTSRTMSIRCCRDILQQGRCTLVTMLQIYKILGVNCLVNALVLSQLHLHGVKQGDRQLTTVGIAIAAMFLFVTKSKPLASLSQDRPPSTVLCTSALASIAVQFFVHWICIAIVTSMSLIFLDPDDPSMTPDGPFHPNTLNTATFIITVVATLNTFIVNYRGKPYMQSLRDNKMLWRSYLVCMVLTVMCTLEVLPPLNDLLQLSPLPNDLPGSGDAESSMSSLNGIYSFLLQLIGFKATLVLLMLGDTLVTFGLEREIGRCLESKQS